MIDMANPFDIDVRRRPGRTTEITVRGELDMATAPHLREVLAQCVCSRPCVVLVDLTELDFIGAEGGRILAQARGSLADDCLFTVVTAKRRAAWLLEFMGVPANCIDLVTAATQREGMRLRR